MKPTLLGKQHRHLLNTTVGSTGWALCIGAGTSLPIFPSWKLLVTKLVARVDEANASSIAEELLRVYSPDSVLQAVHAMLAMSEQEYTKILSEALYSFVDTQLDPAERLLFRNVLAQSGAACVSSTLWAEFAKLRERHLAQTTACQLARVIATVISTESQPSEILSFNAEPLLYALIESYCYEKFREKHLEPSDNPKRLLDFVTGSISSYKKGRIQYVFNHGTLPPPEAKASRRIASTDKLVFREGEYLNLANTAFSWQSATFLEVCLRRPTVFVGVSLSDPNMRRWLAWIQMNRSREVEMSGGIPRISTRHFWINKRPERDYMARWIEACVYHLGVRIIWIDRWDDVGATLSSMLGADQGSA